jgi:hypothetical protein
MNESYIMPVPADNREITASLSNISIAQSFGSISFIKTIRASNSLTADDEKSFSIDVQYLLLVVH